MIYRHRRLSGDHSREHHDAVAGREDGLAGAAAEIDPAMTRQPVLGRFCRKRVPRAAEERAASRIACLLTPCLRRHSRRSRQIPRLVELRARSSFLDLAWSSARFNADQTGNPQGSRRSTTAGSVCCYRGGYGIGGRGRTLVERSVLAQSDFARPRTFSGLGWSWFSRNRSDGRAGARAGITRSPASTGLKV